MQTLQFDLDKYDVSLDLPLGLDADAITILAIAAQLNDLTAQEISAKLNSLGCVNVVVSAR